jgi:hypothetical protein
MMGFLEWVEFNRKKKGKEEKNVRSISQSSQENGNVDHKGQANRFDQEIPEPIVYRFTEPR